MNFPENLTETHGRYLKNFPTYQASKFLKVLRFLFFQSFCLAPAKHKARYRNSMTKYYKKKTFKGRKVARIFSLILSLIGVAIFLYVAFPVISWQIYFAPIFA